MRQLILTQYITTPEKRYALSVFFAPQEWYRGPFPTSVAVEGDVPEEVLQSMIEYASYFGWRWDGTMRRFYPTNT
jgi:hypothetical protein